MNRSSESPAEIIAELNDLLVNCPDFDRLESLLGGFNLFQVLKFEYGELRHSNVLAWLLDPSESHGLDEAFLKKWLMRVLHEANSLSPQVSAVDIDGWRILDVEVRREWRNIDVLVILRHLALGEWIITIENKVKSQQHSNQLHRYRETVELEFPTSARRLFFFLTKSGEKPSDPAYIPASYTQVHRALSECLRSHGLAIGSQPKVLIENYLQLLEEKFMNESEIARTALRIYQQHRRALDVIFEHRPEDLHGASEHLRELVQRGAKELQILPEVSEKKIVRLTPKAWDMPQNSHGTAWRKRGCTRTILLELDLRRSEPLLCVMAGDAPAPWIDPLWARSASAPFRRQERASRPPKWCGLHEVVLPRVSLDDEDMSNPEKVAQKIYRSFVETLRTPELQAVIGEITTALQTLQPAGVK